GVHYRRWQWSDQEGKRLPLDESDRFVSGKIIVLAANGIENPMILLRSDAANSSKTVGCYLMDHPIKQSYCFAIEPLYPFRGPQTTSQIENFRDTGFRREFAAFKTSIKNDGWSTNTTGAPRGARVAAQKEAEDWHPGTLLDLVQNWGFFGDQLREKLSNHAVRQITLNSACEQLPVKENSVSKSTNLDELKLERPLIQYRVDSDDNYVRKSFKKMSRCIRLSSMRWASLAASCSSMTIPSRSRSAARVISWGQRAWVMTRPTRWSTSTAERTITRISSSLAAASFRPARPRIQPRQSRRFPFALWIRFGHSCVAWPSVKMQA